MRKVLNILSPLKVILLFSLLFFFSLSQIYAANITLQWDENTESDLEGYKVYYKTGSSGPPYGSSIEVSLAQLEHPAPGIVQYMVNVPDGEVYFFVVTAYSAEAESGYSNEVNTKAPQITSPPTVTSTTQTTAVIEWTTDEPGTSVVEYGSDASYGSIERDEYISTGLTAHTLTWAGIWLPNELVGLKVNPDITQDDGFTIISNTSNTITTNSVDGDMTSVATAGNSFEVLRTSHRVVLSTLAGSTTYNFRVSSTDAFGNGPDKELDDNNPSQDDTFTTDPVPDTTPPTITSTPSVTSVTDITATIEWTTDEPADNRVYFRHQKTEDYDSVISALSATTLTDSDTPGWWEDMDPDGMAVLPDELMPAAEDISNIYSIISWNAGTGVITTDPADPDMTTTAAVGDTYRLVKRSQPLVINHIVTLTRMKPGTGYTAFVGSKDGSDNYSAASSEVAFTTTVPPDQTAPQIISFPTVTSKTNTTAVIEWATDEPGTSMVEYGPTTSYGYTQTLTGYVTNHSVTLTGLNGSTLYHFRVSSTDAAGNGPDKEPDDNNPSTDASFTTEDDPDEIAPQITSPPTVTAKKNTTATIEWTTDEPGNSVVQYGENPADWDSYDSTESDPDMVTNHSVTITGLTGSTIYHFRVGSTDAAGNGPDKEPDDNNPSAEVGFTTDPDPDTTAPQITSPPTVTAKTNTTATIEWTTDEPGNSVVQYGENPADWDSYDSTESDPDMVTNHSVTITGLTGSSPYYFRVGSTDAAGNGPDKEPDDNNPSAEVGFATDPDPDTTAPHISGITAISTNDTTAVILWTTDEPSNSLVQYDMNQDTHTWGSYPSSENDAGMVTYHNVTLTGLDPNTDYYYRVGSTDAAGNGPYHNMNSTNPSTEEPFTTALDPDTTAPQIISGPTVVSKTNTSAVIEWTTNELGNSLVQYDTDTSFWGSYPSSENDAGMVTKHSVTLTGLDPNTDYYYRVGSTDAFGNGPDPSAELSFTTDPDPDTIAPQITSGPTVTDFTYNTATIEWETDEPGNTMVRYGTSSSSTWGGYQLSKDVSEMVTSHIIIITGLTGGTTYYYMVGSTDASGNGPDKTTGDDNPSTQNNFTTDPSPPPPKIVPYPTINYANNTIDVTYDTSYMQHASLEANYTFTPALYFRTLGGSDDIFYIGSNTYRLYMDYIPYYTIFTLTVSNITDEAGKEVDPDYIKINDNDNDNMADNWETDYGVSNPNEDPDGDGLANVQEFDNFTDPKNEDTDSDDLPDGWEVNFGLDPLDDSEDNGGYGDSDNDGWTNYQEYINGTNPTDPNDPAPPGEIKESIPHNNAGITDTTRVPNNTSFAIRIEDLNGIDKTVLNSITFTIDDSVNFPYDYNLGHTTVVRVVKLDSTEDDDNITKLWAVYDRSTDDGCGNKYAFEATITINVAVKNTNNLITQGDYSFKVETQQQHDDAEANLPSTTTTGDLPLIGLTTINADSGSLKGAKIVYDSGEPVIPILGPLNEIPTLNISGVEAVGVPMNLQPPTIFDTPVTIFIPCPGYQYARTLSIYRYNGTSWVLACGVGGNIETGGEGWMVPGSRVSHDNGSPSTIEIQVYHFAGVQAGSPSGSVGRSTSEVAGEGCFIATAAYGSNMDKHVKILSEFRDKHLLTNSIGRSILDAYKKFSPPVANYLHKHPFARAVVRYALIPITGIAYISLSIHPLVLLFAFIFMLLTGVFFFKRSAIRSQRSAM